MHHILPLSLVGRYFPPAFGGPHVWVLVWKSAFSTSCGDVRGLHYVIWSDYHVACDVGDFLLRETSGSWCRQLKGMPNIRFVCSAGFGFLSSSSPQFEITIGVCGRSFASTGTCASLFTTAS